MKSLLSSSYGALIKKQKQKKTNIFIYIYLLHSAEESLWI